MRFKFTGTSPDELANGRPLAFGDMVALSRREAAENARLIEAGRLVPVPRKPKTTERTDQ